MSPFKIVMMSALCAVSVGAMADDKIEGIQACMKIQWNAQFLKEHPRAPAGCQSVVTRDGAKYAKFSGVVKSVSATEATVAMKNVAGTEGTTIKVVDRWRCHGLDQWQGYEGLRPQAGRQPEFLRQGRRVRCVPDDGCAEAGRSHAEGDAGELRRQQADWQPSGFQS